MQDTLSDPDGKDLTIQLGIEGGPSPQLTIARHLAVPCGPQRHTIAGPFALNVASQQLPILGGPGKLKAISIVVGAAQVAALARATSQVKIYDNNFDLIASAIYDFLAPAGGSVGGGITVLQQSGLDTMFANGLYARVDILNAGFSGPSFWWTALWFESIPIGG